MFIIKAVFISLRHRKYCHGLYLEVRSMWVLQSSEFLYCAYFTFVVSILNFLGKGEGVQEKPLPFPTEPGDG
jgi:hypothetical protein